MEFFFQVWKGPGITTLQVKFLTVTKGNKYLQKRAKLTFNIRGNCLKMFYNYLKSFKTRPSALGMSDPIVEPLEIMGTQESSKVLEGP